MGYPSYICGDFNINLLKIHTKTHYNTFFENLLSSGFFPKITLPTRICDSCSTVIDNIFSNVIEPNSVNLLVSLTVETQGIVTEITYVTQLFILISFSNKINHILPVYLALCKYDFLVNLSFPRTYRRTHCRMNFYYIEHYPVFKSIHAYCSTTLIHVLPLNYNGMALTFIYAMIYVLYVFLQIPRVNGYSPSWSINLTLSGPGGGGIFAPPPPLDFSLY